MGAAVKGWELLLQAMPTGEETDFILVSCAGALVADDEPATAAAVLSHKRKGEQALRHSGLGYTIIRPGPLLEEPGGYKALVFDQVRPTLDTKQPPNLRCQTPADCEDALVLYEYGPLQCCRGSGSRKESLMRTWQTSV